MGCGGAGRKPTPMPSEEGLRGTPPRAADTTSPRSSTFPVEGSVTPAPEERGRGASDVLAWVIKGDPAPCGRARNGWRATPPAPWGCSRETHSPTPWAGQPGDERGARPSFFTADQGGVTHMGSDREGGWPSITGPPATPGLQLR